MEEDDMTEARREPTWMFNEALSVLYPAFLITFIVGLLYPPIQQDGANVVILMTAFTIAFGLWRWGYGAK